MFLGVFNCSSKSLILRGRFNYNDSIRNHQLATLSHNSGYRTCVSLSIFHGSILSFFNSFTVSEAVQTARANIINNKNTVRITLIIEIISVIIEMTSGILSLVMKGKHLERHSISGDSSLFKRTNNNSFSLFAVRVSPLGKFSEFVFRKLEIIPRHYEIDLRDSKFFAHC